TTPVFTLFQLEVESAKNTEKMLAFEQSIYETRPRFIKGTFTISASLRERCLFADYLVLYVQFDEAIHWLSIKHHRQLSFDFSRLWPEN
ncbi:MAG: hypothetical protein Q8P42_09565, partial [Gallionella sp.]|nr:hypothetical protein [Gallionella sp.]